MLADNGVAVTAGQLIAVSDLAAGKLSYTPAAFDFSFPYTTFQFQVQDDGARRGRQRS